VKRTEPLKAEWSLRCETSSARSVPSGWMMRPRTDSTREKLREYHARTGGSSVGLSTFTRERVVMRARGAPSLPPGK
jgi:hypothetical protein